jgi:FMN reductase
VSSVSAIGIVVGNPRRASRTLTVAETIAAAVAETLGLADAPRVTVDLAELGPSLFDWNSSEVRQAVDAIRACAVVVIASPTYKASYTGLLKSFLDWFGTTDLARAVVVPVMVGAGEQHALAVEVHLRPVLVELGAVMPTRGFYVTEAELEQLGTVVATWLEESGPRLRAAVGPHP